MTGHRVVSSIDSSTGLEVPRRHSRFTVFNSLQILSVLYITKIKQQIAVFYP
jgi:hypothetical protein